jgi:parallel beta-helix repeat protein
MNAVRRWAGVLLAALLASLAVPGPTYAASGRTVYVDDNGVANAVGKGKCGRPNYSTIQAAVDDLSVGRVVVCKGTYVEQVAVTRSLTLEGRSGAVIEAPAVLGTSGSIVSFNGAQESRLRGFIISGASTADERLGAGVSVNDGAQVTISHNRIRDIRGLWASSTQGVGISVDGAHADISDNRIERYGIGGILVTSPGGFAQIDDNIIRGHEAPELNNGQIGINIREGGQGDVEDNRVTGNKQGGGGIGIVVDQTANVSLRDNTVRDNDRGIVLGDETGDIEVRSNEIRNNTGHGVMIIDAGGNRIVENEISGNGGDGIRVQSADPPATDNLIDSNEISDSGGNGISLDVGAINNQVSDNEVSDSGGLDILDENGTPLVNTYSDNDCDTSNPSGLCED